MRKGMLLFIMSLYLTGCFTNKQEYPVLWENFSLPKEMNPGLSVLFSETYEITPLETTTESLIGRIDKIRKFQGSYYILSEGKSILHFNNQGLFVSSLNKLGSGPEEYHRIEDFDIYEIEGEAEVWISDNKNLKIYDAYNFSFKYAIAYPFIIHKFKRLENSNILLVTGQNDYSLTLTDKKGKVISTYLKKEIPFLMFRPVQFIRHGSDYIYQLGISNTYIAFDQETGSFRKGWFSGDKTFLSDKELVNLFNHYGMEFIREANKGAYISNIISHKDRVWVNSYIAGKNYLTKVKPGETVSTLFSFESTIKNDLFEMSNSSFISTITMGESDDSILMYINSYTLSENEKSIFDKYGNQIHCSAEDNPCLIEFFFP